MAREWSRRSIEEIARKIAKGLGGGFYKSGDLKTGTFWSRYDMNTNHLVLFDTKVGDSPDVKMQLPAFRSMEGVSAISSVYLLGPCPFFGQLDLSSPSNLSDATRYALDIRTFPTDVNSGTFPLFDRSNNQFDVILQTCDNERYSATEYNLSQDYTTSDIKFEINVLYMTEANSNKYYPNGGFNIPCIFVTGSQVQTIWSAMATWWSRHTDAQGQPALIMRAI